MPNGGVKDLLVQLKLDGSNFKTEMNLAKGEVKLLESELKAVKSDQTITDAGALVKGNLEEQIKAVTAQIDAYERRIGDLKNALASTAPGSKENSALTKDMMTLETSLNDAKTHLNNIKSTLDDMNASDFVESIGALNGILHNMDMAYGALIGDWAADTADSADAVAVAREAALADVEKIAEDRPGWYAGWKEDTDQFIREVITEMPATYNEVATVMANAMQAGGVPVENIEEFTKAYVRLEKSTNLTGAEGVQRYGKFLTVMEAGVDEYERLSSVIVELGNNFAATESDIVETAVNSASALKAAGFSPADILAVSTSANALGMQPAAAASSLSKLGERFGAAAEFGAKRYGEMKDALHEYNYEFDTFYELQNKMDSGFYKRNHIIAALGVTGPELDHMMEQAIQAEKVASLMNMTVGEFSSAWDLDPAMVFVDLFERIGQLDETGAESVFNTLDSLGIHEIREGRVARNFALVNDNLRDTLTIAREARDENVALMRESEKLFETTQSRRVMNQNKNENWLSSIGQGVTKLRQPWDDFFSDLRQNLTVNLPDWATTGFGMVVEILGSFGNLLKDLGGYTQGIYYAGQIYKDIKATDWNKVRGATGKLLKTGGKVIGGAAVVTGLIGLVDLLAGMASDTSEISQNLSNLEINIDEKSKNDTLAAIAEVKAASAGLSVPELDERYAGTSAIVKRGYGTMGMFGQALAYEQARGDAAIAAIYDEYGAKIAAEEARLLNATDEGEMRLIQQRIAALEAEMADKVDVAKAEYGKAVNDLVNGAIKSQAGAEDKLRRFGEKSDLLELLIQSSKLSPADAEKFWKENDLHARLLDAGFDPWNDYLRRRETDPTMIKRVYESMYEDVKAIVSEDGGLGTLLSTTLESGALDNADLSAINGNFFRLLQAVDMKGVGEAGAANWKQVGAMYMGGLQSGIVANGGLPVSAVEQVVGNMISTARQMLDIHSPSRVAREMGLFWDEGLAGGLLDGRQRIVAAMHETMLALQAEAERMSPRINAAMQVAAGGASLAGAAAGGGRGVGNSFTNYFNIGGADLSSQQNVKKLAQQIARVQRKTNASVGKA